MPVYVDHARHRYRRMLMCHMLADTLPELHAMARKIGLRREWFQQKSTPHYDLCQTKRRLAVAHGAVEVDRKELIAVIKKWRASNSRWEIRMKRTRHRHTWIPNLTDTKSYKKGYLWKCFYCGRVAKSR